MLRRVSTVLTAFSLVMLIATSVVWILSTTQFNQSNFK